MEIIKATKNDIETLMKIRMEMLMEVNSLSDDYVFDKSFIENCRKNFECTGETQTDILCIENGAPVACANLCYLSMIPTFSHPTGKRAHLMNVYVKKDFRRKGLAKKMLELLIEEAKSRKVTEISLDATEKGRPLYESMGFSSNDSAMTMKLSME